MNKRDLLSYSFLIIMASWVAFHLLALVIYQQVQIAEFNRWVSIPEFIFTIAVLGLGIERYITCIKRSRRRK